MIAGCRLRQYNMCDTSCKVSITFMRRATELNIRTINVAFTLVMGSTLQVFMKSGSNRTRSATYVAKSVLASRLSLVASSQRS